LSKWNSSEEAAAGIDSSQHGEEDTLKRASVNGRLVLAMVPALLAIPQFPATAQKPPAAGQSGATTSKSAPGELAKTWHSDATQHDYRVEVTGDVFRAEWVNIPPAAAKQGAHIRTECRRAGDKWIGSSSVNMLFAVPGAPAGKDTKVCHLTVRFEVDSITPEKIAGHSEALRNFDVGKCQVLKTTWGEFTWVPKK
jgi:hypothetical protein